MEQGEDEPQRDGGGLENIPEEERLRDVYTKPDHQPDVERLSGCGQSPQFKQATQIPEHQPPERREDKGRLKGSDRTDGQQGSGNRLKFLGWIHGACLKQRSTRFKQAVQRLSGVFETGFHLMPDRILGSMAPILPVVVCWIRIK